MNKKSSTRYIASITFVFATIGLLIHAFVGEPEKRHRKGDEATAQVVTETQRFQKAEVIGGGGPSVDKVLPPPFGMDQAEWDARVKWVLTSGQGTMEDIAQIHANKDYEGRLREFRGEADARKRAQSAEWLNQHLDERIKNREILWSLGLDIKAELLSAMQMDENSRSSAMESWKESMREYAPRPLMTEKQIADYEAAQQAAIQQSGRPVEDLSQEELIKLLEPVRKKFFE